MIMKKAFKNVGIVLLGITIMIAIMGCPAATNEKPTPTLTQNQKNENTLNSFKSVHDMFQMTYYSDYGFDKFLAIGAEKDLDIQDFFQGQLGVDAEFVPAEDPPAFGCSAFLTQNENDEWIYGRNFDYPETHILQLFTTPGGGDYASVSTVDMKFIGFTDLTVDPAKTDEALLAAAFTPFDGMNEHGVAISILRTDATSTPYDDDKETLNVTTALRLVLDKANSVGKAVELLNQYNIYFTATTDTTSNTECHYFIADNTGKSVIVEFVDGDLVIIDRHIVTNFVLYNFFEAKDPVGNVVNDPDEYWGEDPTTFSDVGKDFAPSLRYNELHEVLPRRADTLTEEKAIALLLEEPVGYVGDEEKGTQWSVLYNLTNLTGKIYTNVDSTKKIEFSLK